MPGPTCQSQASLKRRPDAGVARVPQLLDRCRHLAPALSTGRHVRSTRDAYSCRPCVISSRCRFKREVILSSSCNSRRAPAHSALPLAIRLCSFIAAPLSPLRRRTSRPTSYGPVSPASPPRRCSQPRGKSTTGVPT
jgi:hypothetical protein